MKITQARVKQLKGMQDYFTIEFDFLNDENVTGSYCLQLSNYQYNSLCYAMTGQDEVQHTDPQVKKLFTGIAKSIKGLQIDPPACQHVVDNQGYCHICGMPASQF